MSSGSEACDATRCILILPGGRLGRVKCFTKGQHKVIFFCTDWIADIHWAFNYAPVRHHAIEQGIKVMRLIYGISRLMIAGIAMLLTLSASQVWADSLVDLRHGFPSIQPYTKPPSQPVSRQFSIPGPGTLQVTTVFSPWFRSSEQVQFRSTEPVDGRDEAAWSGHIPGVDKISSSSTPERWVDSAMLSIVSNYRVRKPRPGLQVALFPSTVRFGDGSILQLANSVQVIIVFTPTEPQVASKHGAGLLGGAVLPCEARDGGKSWPCTLQITSYDKGTGAIDGRIDWNSLGSVHRIRGTLNGNHLTFTEVESLKAGRARLNVDYIMTLSASVGVGRYFDRGDGSSGQMQINLSGTAEP